jgi:hypothetical protein
MKPVWMRGWNRSANSQKPKRKPVEPAVTVNPEAGPVCKDKLWLNVLACLAVKGHAISELRQVDMSRDGQFITLFAGTPFMRVWLEKHWREPLEQAFTQLSDRPVNLTIRCGG